MRKAGLIAFAALWLPAHAAGAANSATFRDCSLAGGVDPDFVELSGAALGPNGNLTAPSSPSSVTVESSESSNPGDSFAHDSLSVTVTGSGIGSNTFSGAGIGQVTLTVPLEGVSAGNQYSVNWAATFDNGFHHCPGSTTPQNPTSNPFVLDVLGETATRAPTISRLRASRRRWRQGTINTFSFDLNEPAGVMLVFRQWLHGRLVPRGALVRTGRAGLNIVRFRGQLAEQSRLPPGRYVLVASATNVLGETSNRATISFVITRRSGRRA